MAIKLEEENAEILMNVNLMSHAKMVEFAKIRLVISHVNAKIQVIKVNSVMLTQMNVLLTHVIMEESA